MQIIHYDLSVTSRPAPFPRLRNMECSSILFSHCLSQGQDKYSVGYEELTFLLCVEGPRCLYEKAHHCWNLAMLISKQPHNEININIPILQRGNLTEVTSSKQSLNSKPHLSDPTSGFISLTLYDFLFLIHSVIWSSVMTDYVPTTYQTLFWSEQDRKSSYPWGSYIIMDKADNKPVK